MLFIKLEEVNSSGNRVVDTVIRTRIFPLEIIHLLGLRQFQLISEPSNIPPEREQGEIVVPGADSRILQK